MKHCGEVQGSLLEEEPSTFSVHSRDKVLELLNAFRDHFLALGYREERAVKISSGVDGTVDLIGSGISTLKKYFLPPSPTSSFQSGKPLLGTIPNPGVFVIQRCIRTRNIKNMLQDEFQPNWGSTFTNFVLIAPPSRAKELSLETFEFFAKRLSINQDKIIFRVSSEDKELWAPITEYFSQPSLEKDTQPKKYYTHSIGHPQITAKSYNIALKSSSDVVDVGNIIFHFLDTGVPLCTEIGFGDSTILKQLYNLSHVTEVRTVPGLESIDFIYKAKFSDVIVVIMELLREGVSPLRSDTKERTGRGYNRQRTLKKYFLAVSYFRCKTRTPLYQLYNSAFGYVYNEFNEKDTMRCGEFITYLKAIEASLFTSKALGGKALGEIENRVLDAWKSSSFLMNL